MTRFLLATALLTIGLSVAHAEIVELEDNIKSVDAAKREITVGKKTLDVSKKCRVTIDGDEADLSDLKVDQKVTVEYDDELDVARAITVGETGVGSDAMTKDLKALQGKWYATTLFISGRKLTKSEMQRHSRWFEFKGNSYTEEMIRDGVKFTIRGKYEIDPATKAFDFIGRGQFEGKEPNPGALEMFGFYEVDGDKLKLVIRAKPPGANRPKKFGEGDEGKAWTNSFILERDE